ncbi:hypothetical protein HOK51_06645 [Candidatus Woesearchaeota archaeon]|jgi:phosphatidylserine/phosphatidylglycerophosphate/cardiolipin synthase-like enzyme|nr:hypothetical protein [Candidatus Woesearchaeota archaeon]MBT7368723.1 hypothetical protein [Candidatus Woesearchaeota archaeon]
MKLKYKIGVIIILIALALNYGIDPLGLIKTAQEKVKENTANLITGNILSIPSEFNKEINVYFCPKDNCQSEVLKTTSTAKSSIHCAIFDLDLPDLIEFFDKASNYIDVKIVVDNENWKHVKHLNFTKKDSTSQFSHNKFCVIDNNKIWTGSFNPTENGNYKNNNNLLIIESETLAKNYEDEFREIWNGKFGKGDLVKNPKVKINTIDIENYFCPEDWCANKVLDQLNKANHSIYFMTFSFTHDEIGDMILKKSDEGIKIKGIFEKKQQSKYSEYEKINSAFEKLESDKTKQANQNKVIFDSNPAAMHHKVFIIDEKTVITGSFNPTKNGDTNNDENILIIHDEKIASKFMDEFNSLWIK